MTTTTATSNSISYAFIDTTYNQTNDDNYGYYAQHHSAHNSQ
ncbi:hypothetical protein ACTZI8_12235 [Escherichia coli]